ncbi:MAG TPA: phosphatidate cytidylyltransferase [Candidatus Krumholzibacteriaceae bacterium]|nr:phosphatidate cytidylyltransferase [Candidatus Krumholzibacteriaceae bacterium]
MSENKIIKDNNKKNSVSNRSILKRIIISIIFLPFILLITRKGGLYFLVLITILITSGLWEFYRMVEAKGIKPSKLIGITCGIIIPFSVFFSKGKADTLLFLLVIIFIAVMIIELGRGKRNYALYHISVTIFGVLYVGLLGSYLLMLRELPVSMNLDYKNGFLFVILVFILTWCYDTGAYTFGKIAGRHKLFPSVSPGKTLEGALGGVLLSCFGILVAREYILPFITIWEAVGLAVVGSVVSQLGDLVESMIKRDVNIKDSSNTIPGHGGILDRFDSMLFNAPAIYYILKYFILKG